MNAPARLLKYYREHITIKKMEVFMKTRTEVFELLIDGKPLVIKATPYQTATTETRFRVSVNNSPVHIFGWDKNLNRLTAIEHGSATGDMPKQIDEAVGRELYHLVAAA